MKALARFAAAGLVLGLAAQPATAQLANNPTYFAPNGGTGLTVSGEYGAGMNNASGKGYSLNARGELGMPMINIGAGVGLAYPNGGGNSTVNFEGNAGLTLMSLPLSGISVSAHGAVGYISPTGGNKIITVPVGITVGVKPPSPGVSLEPWASARLHYVNVSSSGPGGGASSTNVGLSAGVNVGLPIGVGLHAALDYLNVSGGSPILFGIGAHYTFSVPGMGIVPGT